MAPTPFPGAIPPVPLPRYARPGGYGRWRGDNHTGGGLIGNALGLNGNPLYDRWRDFAETDALIPASFAMMNGDMSTAAQALMYGSREAREDREDRERRERYAQLLSGWGDDYGDLAEGVYGGALSPNEAFVAGLNRRQDMKKQADELERNRRNAAFIPDPQLRQMVESGALNFKDAYDQWKQGSQPDYRTFESNGDIYRYDGNNPNSRPEMWFDGPNAGGSLPADVQEYQWYADQEKSGGRQPLSYLDFIQAQKGNGLQIETGPDGVTRISQGGPSGAYGRKADTEMAGMSSEIQKQAIGAVSGLDTIDAMEQAMADPSFYSGFGADQVMGLKKAAAALGIDPKGVTSMESFNALSKQSALSLMGGSLGSGFSNADRDFVVQQTASLGNTPEGNRELLNIQRKLLRRKQDIAVFAQQYAQQNGGQLDDRFSAALSQWAEQNPLFDDAGEIGEGTVIEDGNGNRLVLQGGQWVPY